MKITHITATASRKACRDYQTREVSLSATAELEPGEKASEATRKLTRHLQDLVDSAIGDPASPHAFSSTRLEKDTPSSA